MKRFYRLLHSVSAPRGRKLVLPVSTARPRTRLGDLASRWPSQSRQRCYWSWPQPGRMLNDAEVVDDFAQALDESVRLRLPQGVLRLPAQRGIDSASVLALGGRPWTYRYPSPSVSGFPSSDHDEAGWLANCGVHRGRLARAGHHLAEQLLGTLEGVPCGTAGPVAVNNSSEQEILLAQRLRRVTRSFDGRGGWCWRAIPIFARMSIPSAISSWWESVSAGILVSSGAHLAWLGWSAKLGWSA